MQPCKTAKNLHAHSSDIEANTMDCRSIPNLAMPACPLRQRRPDRKETDVLSFQSRRPQQPAGHNAMGHRGYVYCAALNIHRAAAGVSNAAQADILLCALANLQELAMPAGLSASECTDLFEWRLELEAKVQNLRDRARSRLNSSTKPSVSVQISPSFNADFFERRASA
jgi:hypothetical protein